MNDEEVNPFNRIVEQFKLMQEYDVAYDTAQHAVKTLEAEGLVRRYPGRGYYVTARG